MRPSQLFGSCLLLSGVRAVTFTSCTAAQISTLEVAIDRATNKSYAAIEHLEASPNGSDIQTTWYGAFSTERYNKVLTAFKVRDHGIIAGFCQARRNTETNDCRNSRPTWPQRSPMTAPA